MSDWNAYLWVAAGVLVAVIFPILSAYIKREFPPTAGPGFPPWLTRYLLLGVFCLVTAVIALAIYRNANPGTQLVWFNAFLIGFGWEPAVEKCLRPTA